MSSGKTNNNTSGGIAGRAAPGMSRGAAWADDLRVIARCAAFMGFAAFVLVLNADTLWPHLFAP
jgi:hypothetical protein